MTRTRTRLAMRPTLRPVVFIVMAGALPLTASAGPPVEQPPPGGATAVQTGPVGGGNVSPAINAALGRRSAPASSNTFGNQPPPQGEYNPGFTDRRGSRQAEQTYGPSARSVDAEGNVITGLQLGTAGQYDDPNYAPEVPDYHVVQRGDTLWDISGYYMRDPYLWPKVWSWNDHVTNAHWIFPGDRIRLYDPFGPRVDPRGPSLRFTKTKLPLGARRGPYLLNQVAYVDADQFDTAMTIVGGGDAKVMMATLDTVYMEYNQSNPPVPGERLVVYSPQEKVYDPEGKKVVGWLVQVASDVEIETLARKTVEGTLHNAVNPVERGYKVGPLTRRFRRVDPVEADKSAVGQVIATLNDTGPIPYQTKKRRKQIGDYVLAGEEQFVIVNLGEANGVEVGNVLEVVRKGDEYTPKRVFNLPYEEGWPRRVIGALLVVEVEDRTCLAVSIYSRKEFERGDHVELRGRDFDEAGTQNDPVGGGRKGADASGSVERDDGSAKAKGGFTVGK